MNSCKIAIFLLIFCFTNNIFAQKYEIEPQHAAKNKSDEMFLLKVWSYAKDRQEAQSLCLKNAVYAIMFDTIPPLANNNPIPPLIKNISVKNDNHVFFENFFEKEKLYLKYVAIVGLPETIKIGKEYKVGLLVSINKGQLRSYLEKNIGNIYINN